MPTTTGNDTITLSEGPKVRVNSDPSTNWSGQAFDGLGGFDTLVVDESSTKASYFSFSMSNDGIVTFTSASGGSSKTVSFVNMEKIQFWDVTMLLGSSGNDTVTGTNFADSLYGFDGNDTLDGLGGADKMYGGNGKDIYVVDNVGDIVSELAGEGTDLVKSSISYSLVDTDGSGANGGNVENLTLSGTDAIDGTGNDGKNRLTGNGASNTLDGGLGNDLINGGRGADILIGGGGNDKFMVDDAGDVVNEFKGEGTDTVVATVGYRISNNVENLFLSGTGNYFAGGNNDANVIKGNNGNNKITGYGGRDSLTGKAGADKFDFNKISDSEVGSRHDTIQDFQQGTDLIDLKNIDADSTVAKNQAFTFLDGDGTAFGGHAGELQYHTASGNTLVAGDVNGDGNADFEIQLKGSFVLTADDFIL